MLAATHEPGTSATEVVEDNEHNKQQESETVSSLGWQSMGLDDDSMQNFVIAAFLLTLALKLLSWIFQFSLCFWSCLLFCLRH